MTEISPEAGCGGEREVARLRLRADPALVDGALRFLREAAASAGVAPDEAERIGPLLGPLCRNVIDHGFLAGDRDAAFELALLRGAGRVVIRLEDRGMPFDYEAFEHDGEQTVAELLARSFLDDVTFSNRGREGNRVELVRNLPAARLDATGPAEQEAAEAEPAPEGVPIEIRLMRPDQSVGLTRLVYRAYGYTYDNEQAYHPDRLRDLQESGLQHSIVAVAPKGEIVGHIAYVRENAQARVGESGQALVDPRYRGHGLFDRMKEALIEHCTALGAYGMYGNCVTVHPYTQRGSLKLGGRETGILLGYIPAGVVYRKITDGELPERQTAVQMYTRTNPEPAREVHLPPGQAEMLAKLYARSGLDRVLLEPPAGAAPPERSEVSVRVRLDHSQAYMRVGAIGPDLLDVLRARLRELRNRRLDVLYVGLPLSDPAAAALCEPLEQLGFFFSGVVPELGEHGDILRLQYLNEVEVDPDRIEVYSDFAKELLAYVVAGMEAAAERIV